jgi:sulfur carrier protein
MCGWQNVGEMTIAKPSGSTSEDTGIWVNGSLVTLPDVGDCVPDAVVSVASLLQVLSLETRGIAIALDGTLVPRSEWDSTPVSPGAHLEIIGAAPGG